jgi:hypothetical protein
MIRRYVIDFHVCVVQFARILNLRSTLADLDEVEGLFSSKIQFADLLQVAGFGTVSVADLELMSFPEFFCKTSL